MFEKQTKLSFCQWVFAFLVFGIKVLLSNFRGCFLLLGSVGLKDIKCFNQLRFCILILRAVSGYNMLLLPRWSWFKTRFDFDRCRIKRLGQPNWVCFCINTSYLIHTHSHLSIIPLLDKQFIHLFLCFSHLGVAQFAQWLVCLIYF